MNKDDFYYLGKILKTYGNKGHVLVSLDVDNPEDYKYLESVYLDLHGERIPFFIESLELKHNKKAVFHFQDVETIEDADIYIGLELFLPLSQLPPLQDEQFYFHEIKGFKVIDEKHGPLGFVDDILELPRQSLLQVVQDKKELLIPIVDEVILHVDRKNKTLYVRTPEGLVEIYL